MGWRKVRNKGEKGAAIVKFMDKRFGVRVVVVDSVGDPDGIAVLCEDGGLLSAEQARELSLFLKGYRVFGGPS